MMKFNEKPLSEVKGEREQQEIEANTDIYEAIAGLNEEVEALKAEIAKLKGGTQ